MDIEQELKSQIKLPDHIISLEIEEHYDYESFVSGIGTSIFISCKKIDNMKYGIKYPASDWHDFTLKLKKHIINQLFEGAKCK